MKIFFLASLLALVSAVPSGGTGGGGTGGGSPAPAPGPPPAPAPADTITVSKCFASFTNPGTSSTYCTMLLAAKSSNDAASMGVYYTNGALLTVIPNQMGGKQYGGTVVTVSDCPTTVTFKSSTGASIDSPVDTTRATL